VRRLAGGSLCQSPACVPHLSPRCPSDSAWRSKLLVGSLCMRAPYDSSVNPDNKASLPQVPQGQTGGGWLLPCSHEGKHTSTIKRVMPQLAPSACSTEVTPLSPSCRLNTSSPHSGQLPTASSQNSLWAELACGQHLWSFLRLVGEEASEKHHRFQRGRSCPELGGTLLHLISPSGWGAPGLEGVRDAGAQPVRRLRYSPSPIQEGVLHPSGQFPSLWGMKAYPVLSLGAAGAGHKQSLCLHVDHLSHWPEILETSPPDPLFPHSTARSLFPMLQATTHQFLQLCSLSLGTAIHAWFLLLFSLAALPETPVPPLPPASSFV
jgi:hypothetical protein